MDIKVSFIIGQVHSEEIAHLKSGEPLISKMILTPDDFAMFHYKQGDRIQIETPEGNRLWCVIHSLEVIEQTDAYTLIFSLSLKEFIPVHV